MNLPQPLIQQIMAGAIRALANDRDSGSESLKYRIKSIPKEDGTTVHKVRQPMPSSSDSDPILGLLMQFL